MTVMATEKRNAATGPVRSRKRTWTARLKEMPVSWAMRREDGHLTPFVQVTAVLDDGRPIEIQMTPEEALDLALRLGGQVDTIDKITGFIGDDKRETGDGPA